MKKDFRASKSYLILCDLNRHVQKYLTHLMEIPSGILRQLGGAGGIGMVGVSAPPSYQPYHWARENSSLQGRDESRLLFSIRLP